MYIKILENEENILNSYNVTLSIFGVLSFDVLFSNFQMTFIFRERK